MMRNDGEKKMANFYFRCPWCAVSVDSITGLPATEACAGHCGRSFLHERGNLDFVVNPALREERAFYDGRYEDELRRSKDRPVHAGNVRSMWHDSWHPENRVLIEEMQSAAHKTVLLLGNGTSMKELFVLSLSPALVIYSDLSIVALSVVQNRSRRLLNSDRMVFAAIDAENLPLFDHSVDFVYGYAIVHHLSNRDRLLAEAFRILRPGGKALFMDDGYSPIWQGAKRSVLYPIMRFSQRKSGISPQDLEASREGGFRPAVLAQEIDRVGGKSFHHRVGFLTYFWSRGCRKLLGRRLRERLLSQRLGTLLSACDRFLGNIRGMRLQFIRLIWGFYKPS